MCALWGAGTKMDFISISRHLMQPISTSAYEYNAQNVQVSLAISVFLFAKKQMFQPARLERLKCGTFGSDKFLCEMDLNKHQNKILVVT